MAPLRIRTVLSLSMGGIVLLATVTVLTIAVVSNVRNTYELLNDRSVLIIDALESEVRARLDAASNLVDGLVRQIDEGHLKDDTPEELHKALAVALSATPGVEVLIYWDSRMRRRLVMRAPDGSIVPYGPDAETNQDILATLSAMPAQAHYWGKPVVEDGAAYLNYAGGADTHGSADARFVVAAVSLRQFSEYVDRIGSKQGSTAFILYGKDAVLAHPSLVNRGEISGPPWVPISETGDAVLAGIAGAEPVEFLESARSRFVEAYRVEANNTYYLVMYRWIYGYGPQPLAVGVYFARTEISDTLRRLMLSGLAGILISALGVAAAIWLGGRIARPVRRLAESASAVARLEIDTVPKPPDSAIAELNEQAHAFGLMLDTLKVFGTYVPQRLVRRLMALGGDHSMPSETREVTVMFTDMVHFSEISARMGAEDTATFLNRHFGLLDGCIEAEAGTIDKYIGDAIMAFWGAPDRMDDHAARAVRAARCISETLTADNERRALKGLRPVRVRVGIHTGPVVVGNIGALERVNYTIVGDTVNVAQRLETLGRKLDAGHDVTVLMSAATAERAGLTADEAEDVGGHQLAGNPHPVAVRRLRRRPD